MNEFEDLTSRLKALGDSPVPPPVATQHLTAMAAVPAPRRFSQKLRVAAAFGVGIFVGGTGLGYAAANEALPTQANDAVVAAGRVVGLDIAKDKSKGKSGGNGASEAKGDNADDASNGKNCHGKAVSAAARTKVPGETEEQHGERVKAVAEAKACKGGPSADDADDLEDPADNGQAPEDKGKPADKGKPEATGPDAADNAPAPTPELEEEDDELEDGDLEGSPSEGRPENPGNAPEDIPAP